MDPYKPPITQSEPIKEEVKNLGPKGRACPKCFSSNTTTDVYLRAKPSVLHVILFGWIFLLIRGAFAMKTDRCQDCDHENKYKTTGSWIALAALVIVVLLIILGLSQG